MKEIMNNGNNTNQNGGGFLNGLLVGFLLGGGAVFLFGTKKGKKLLKLITEEGLEGISNIEDLIEDEYEYEQEVEDTAGPQRKTASVKKEVVPTVEEEKKQEPKATQPHPIRRLFRGIPRRK